MLKQVSSQNSERLTFIKTETCSGTITVTESREKEYNVGKKTVDCDAFVYSKSRLQNNK